MALTDEQITELFTHRLNDHNGQNCRATVYDNKSTAVCSGKSCVKDGEVRLFETCGRPCTFLRNATNFAEAVKTLTIYDNLACLAREGKI